VVGMTGKSVALPRVAIVREEAMGDMVDEGSMPRQRSTSGAGFPPLTWFCTAVP
jgi:hypothetical protein